MDATDAARRTHQVDQAHAEFARMLDVLIATAGRVQGAASVEDVASVFGCQLAEQNIGPGLLAALLANACIRLANCECGKARAR